MKMLLVTMAVLCVVFTAGCGERDGVSPGPEEDYEVRLGEDSDLRELISIRDEMTSRALESGVSGAVIAGIVESNDTSRFASILGYTDGELAELGERIALLGRTIRERYPGLEEKAGVDTDGCPACDFAGVEERWNRLAARYGKGGSMPLDGEQNQIPEPDPKQKGVRCRMVPYSAALAGCTSLGPVLYWACATVATCMYCSGGWVDVACQK